MVRERIANYTLAENRKALAALTIELGPGASPGREGEFDAGLGVSSCASDRGAPVARRHLC